MAFRLYIVPSLGDGVSIIPPYTDTTGPRRPKYIAALQPQYLPGGIPGEWWDYGFQPVFLAGVSLTTADDAAVVANSDVIALPFNLETNITGGQINALKNALEAKFIAADYISGGMSWHAIALANAGMFRFMRALYGEVGNIILFDGTGNKTLNAQYGSLPTSIQDAIQRAAAVEGLSTAFITSTTQVRAMFKELSDQSQSKGFRFGPFTI